METIYITHAHFDHFYGLSILLDRFPGARAIATPKTVNAMQMSVSPPVERLARRLFPGQVPTKLVAPEPYEHDPFTLERHELRIIEQGRTDSPDTTSLYVPSIGLIVAGDVPGTRANKAQTTSTTATEGNMPPLDSSWPCAVIFGETTDTEDTAT